MRIRVWRARQLLAVRIQSFQQWTDAALLCLAVENKGKLVTFDAGVKQLAAREWGAKSYY